MDGLEGSEDGLVALEGDADALGGEVAEVLKLGPGAAALFGDEVRFRRLFSFWGEPIGHGQRITQ